MVQIIDGKALAQKMQAALAKKVSSLKAEKGIVPGLAVILVGDNPASQVYVRNKERAALAAGFKSETVRLSDSVCQEELIELIEQYNQDDTIHGILVQLPLPHHINDKRIILAIDPKKDVDGFHPMNTGHLWSGRPKMVPCTPAGIMEMFHDYGIELEGKNAVIVGRSNIVGKDRKSTRLNSSHANISYAVFCLKKTTEPSRATGRETPQRPGESDLWFHAKHISGGRATCVDGYGLF